MSEAFIHTLQSHSETPQYMLLMLGLGRISVLPKKTINTTKHLASKIYSWLAQQLQVTFANVHSRKGTLAELADRLWLSLVTGGNCQTSSARLAMTLLVACCHWCSGLLPDVQMRYWSVYVCVCVAFLRTSLCTLILMSPLSSVTYAQVQKSLWLICFIFARETDTAGGVYCSEVVHEFLCMSWLNFFRPHHMLTWLKLIWLKSPWKCWQQQLRCVLQPYVFASDLKTRKENLGEELSYLCDWWVTERPGSRISLV